MPLFVSARQCCTLLCPRTDAAILHGHIKLILECSPERLAFGCKRVVQIIAKAGQTHAVQDIGFAGIVDKADIRQCDFCDSHIVGCRNGDGILRAAQPQCKGMVLREQRHVEIPLFRCVKIFCCTPLLTNSGFSFCVPYRDGAVDPGHIAVVVNQPLSFFGQANQGIHNINNSFIRERLLERQLHIPVVNGLLFRVDVQITRPICKPFVPEIHLRRGERAGNQAGGDQRRADTFFEYLFHMTSPFCGVLVKRLVDAAADVADGDGGRFPFRQVKQLIPLLLVQLVKQIRDAHNRPPPLPDVRAAFSVRGTGAL